MKKFGFLAIAASLVMTCPVMADNDAPAVGGQGGAGGKCAGGPGGHGGARRQKLMQRFDANGDGQLDDAERQQMRSFFQQKRAANGGPGGRGFRRRMMMQQGGGAGGPGGSAPDAAPSPAPNGQ